MLVGMAGNERPPPKPGAPARDWRDRRADERERTTGEVEGLADEREHQADEREAIADDREQQADQRERHANERERQADARQRRMDQLGSSVADRRRAGLEAIERARVLVADTAQRLNRREAAISREVASDDRSQSEVNRASARSAQEEAGQLPDPRGPVERAEDLRRRLLAAAGSLARAEEEVAQIHDDLAERDPDRSGEYRRVAGEAREIARKAEEVSQLFSRSEEPQVLLPGLRRRAGQGQRSLVSEFAGAEQRPAGLPYQVADDSPVPRGTVKTRAGRQGRRPAARRSQDDSAELGIRRYHIHGRLPGPIRVAPAEAVCLPAALCAVVWTRPALACP
jgi:hypothetical protein